MSDLLSDALPPVPLKDQIACVEREIGMRRRVYPAWVTNGRMKQATADEEIRRMEAVLATLRAVAEAFSPDHDLPALAHSRCLGLYCPDAATQEELVEAFKAEHPDIRTVKL